MLRRAVPVRRLSSTAAVEVKQTMLAAAVMYRGAEVGTSMDVVGGLRYTTIDRKWIGAGTTRLPALPLLLSRYSVAELAHKLLEMFFSL